MTGRGDDLSEDTILDNYVTTISIAVVPFQDHPLNLAVAYFVEEFYGQPHYLELFVLDLAAYNSGGDVRTTGKPTSGE